MCVCVTCPALWFSSMCCLVDGSVKRQHNDTSPCLHGPRRSLWSIEWLYEATSWQRLTATFLNRLCVGKNIYNCRGSVCQICVCIYIYITFFLYMDQWNFPFWCKHQINCIYIESILNASKVSTLMFGITCENKMSKYGWNNVPLSFA